MKERGELNAAKAADFRAILRRIREIAARHRAAGNPSARELHRIASWVDRQWTGQNAGLFSEANP